MIRTSSGGLFLAPSLLRGSHFRYNAHHAKTGCVPAARVLDRAAPRRAAVVVAELDAVIIGGGPAGSTAARLLAQWGYSVVILTAAAPRHSLAECLPPSTRKVFQFLGIQDSIDAAGFFGTTGNTVWWGKTGKRTEPYPEGRGYQVPRRDFDRLLLDLAREAGARVRVGKAFAVPGPAGPRIEFQSGGRRAGIRARFILDCSGRAGVVARSLRVTHETSRTVALCGVWRSDNGWKLPDASHTLVEAYEDGWAWSVPVSPAMRHVAFMVDPVATRLVRGKGIGAAYQAELAKTRAFRKIFSRGTMETAPWGCDASLYSSRRFCGPGFLLAGDAGAFIDPLSSFGVKKAMVSAWAGAVVANTCLLRPAMQQAALQYFDDRERRIYADYLKQSAAWFREAPGPDAQPFWAIRSGACFSLPGTSIDADPDATGVLRALEDLKRTPGIRLSRAAGVQVQQRPGIAGREVVLRNALLAPGMADPVDFLANVNVSCLVDIAGDHRQVPDLFEAYNRLCPPVDLPHFLTALSMLLAKGILVDNSHGIKKWHLPNEKTIV